MLGSGTLGNSVSLGLGHVPTEQPDDLMHSGAVERLSCSRLRHIGWPLPAADLDAFFLRSRDPPLVRSRQAADPEAWVIKKPAFTLVDGGRPDGLAAAGEDYASSCLLYTSDAADE